MSAIQIDLEDQVAVVTGGAGELGVAVAQRLLASGARVSIWDCDVTALDKAESCLGGCRIAKEAVDVTQAEQIETAAKSTLSAFGRLDILVNNAGILGPVTEVWRWEPEEWRRVVDVNLTGAFLCSRAVVPTMIRQGYGRIINISSIQGKEGTPMSGAYAAAKAGMIALTKTVGKELATTGVTVNCVTPAAFEGSMMNSIDVHRRTDILDRIPMGRFCSVDEIAAMVAWICSPDCSFSTGAAFDLSGGRAAY